MGDGAQIRKAGLLAAMLALALRAGAELQDPAPRDELLARASELLRSGRAEAAGEIYTTLIERDPSDAEALEGRLLGLLERDLWQDALAAARHALATRPDDPRMAAGLGRSLFRAGLLDECDRLLSPLAAAPDAPGGTLVTLGRLRAAQGRRAESSELLERAVAAAPHDREVLYWAGDLEGRRGRAVELLRRYLEVSAGDDPERIESVRGTVEFFEALGDRPIWVNESAPDELELPLTRIWDAAGTTEGFVVQAQMGARGKRARLLLDTGSHGLFVLDRIARKRGFAPLAERTIYGGGGDRRHATERGLVDRFALGELGYRDALATTTRDELDPTGRFHGLLGVSLLGGYRVTLDLEAGRLELAQGGEPLEGEPYWWIAGQLLVRGTDGAGHAGLFVLDTGATTSVVATGFVERVDASLLDRAAAVRAFGGRVRDARLVRGMSLELQGHATDGPLVSYDLSLHSRLGGVEIAGLVGLDVLAGRRIVLDTPSQRVRIGPRR